MHIPDGMLSAPVMVATGATSAGFVAYSVAWVRKYLDQRRVVLMAVMAALVFALQMLNFAVAGGTSGHFAGGAAAAILLGPWPAVIVMTTVLLVQSLLFADGGVLAMSANVLNMAVIGPLVGFAIWRLVTGRRTGRRWIIAGAFAAAWAATLASAFAAGFEIWASGRAPFALVMAAMGGWHALIGIGEGAITAGLVVYVLSVRPDLLSVRPGENKRGFAGVVIGLAIVALVGAAMSWAASSLPDGLESMYFGQDIGAPFEEFSLVNSPIANYVMPGVSNQTLAGVLAGIVGLVVVGALVYALVTGARTRRRDAEAQRLGEES